MSCDRTLPTTAFGPNKKVRDGLKGECRECDNKRSREWRRRNPEKVKAAKDRWRRAHPQQHHAHYKKWVKENPERAKYGQLVDRLRRFGLTFASWDAMPIDQLGLCGCCGEQMHKPAIDHDHACCPERRSCGKCIRALLCANCNLMLGMAKEDVARLAAGIRYLQKHGGSV